MSSKQRKVVQAAINQVTLFERLEQRFLLSGGAIWHVQGDRAGSASNDTIVVEADSQDADQLRALVNGQLIGTRDKDAIGGIEISGGGGQDDISVDLDSDYANIDVTLLGGAGDDLLSAGSGDDKLMGGSGDDEMNGAMGDDELLGGPGDDQMAAMEGDDDILGQIGDDTAAGGLGDDEISGGAGKDQLSGGYDDDVIKGGDNSDVVRGGDGVDTLDGNAGRDTVFRQKIDYWKYDRLDTSKSDRRTNPLQKVDDTSELKQWLIDARTKQWEFALGQPAYPWWGYGCYDVCLYATMATNDAAAGGVLTRAPSEAPSHSNTNTQESALMRPIWLRPMAISFILFRTTN